MERKKLTDDEMRDRVLAGVAARLADSAMKSLAAIEEVRAADKPLVPFPLDKTERTTLAGLMDLPSELRSRLAGKARNFAAAEVVSMVMAVANSFATAEPERRSLMLSAAQILLHGIHRGVLMPAWRAEARKRKRTDCLYQLKITLVDTKPTVWRRIQVEDCTLDKLHGYIQTAMGWTNSHLHHFDIDGRLYGDPDLLDETFAEMNYRDSTLTLLSSILPEGDTRLQFKYEYDFGDSWEHDVVFEGRPDRAMGQKYPLCLEGERACPPEDVGGVHGYVEFLRTIEDRKHRERAGMLEWAEGWFDPDEFDATTATKCMWKGIHDWRSAK